MIADWVPFHRQLAEGSKKNLERGVRFVYLELSLKARPHGGVLKLPLPWSTLKAVHDLVGGKRNEIKEALEEFVKPDEDGVSPIEIVKDSTQHRLIITKWSKWAGGKTSTERVQKFRDEKKNKQLGNGETVSRVSEGNGGNAYKHNSTDSTEQTRQTNPPTPKGENVEGDGIPEATEPEEEVQPLAVYDVAWRLWRSMYQQSRRGYGEYVEGGIREERAMQTVAHRADVLAKGDRPKTETVLRHWFASFLRDDGALNCLSRNRHKILLLEERLPTYGMPPSPKPVRTARPALPPEQPPPLPSKERLAELRAMASGASKGFGK